MLCDISKCGWNCSGYCADNDEMENRVLRKMGVKEEDRSKDCPKTLDNNR